MTRLLVVAAVWPEPRSSAAGARMLQLLAPFRERGWTIAYASTAAASEHAAPLEALGIEPHSTQPNDARFDAFLQSYRPDLVLFDRFFVEEQFGWRVEQHCPDALRVLDGEDLHCLRDARERASRRGTPLETRDLLSPLARREIAAILRSDLTLVISSHEMALLADPFRVDAELLHYCPFMVDPPSAADRAALPAFAARRGFVSIGNFRHAPNLDAVQWLKREIWPRIRSALPEARLSVAGAYPSKPQMALHDPGQGFCVAGRVDDADALLRDARVCLAPLRFGAGLKGKLIDAMRNGTPSVTTPIGAEGMAGALPWPGEIAGDADSIAKAALRLYRDATAWDSARDDGFEILEQRFRRDTHAPRLVAQLEAVQRDLPERRLRNFTGAMLRDHRHRSTKYLSRWIEARRQRAAAGTDAASDE